MNTTVVLYARRMCETYGGDLAYAVGRLAFRPGRPMLVEHVGGVYLEHDLAGRVMTPGYGEDYNIAHVWEDEGGATDAGNHFASLPGRDFSHGAVACVGGDTLV